MDLDVACNNHLLLEVVKFGWSSENILDAPINSNIITLNIRK